MRGQQRQGFVVALVRLACLKLHHLYKFGAVLALQQAGFAHAKPLQFISGQVNATAHGVFADIANDVGQLQGAPQSVRIFGGLWLGLPKDAG